MGNGTDFTFYLPIINGLSCYRARITYPLNLIMFVVTIFISKSYIPAIPRIQGLI